MTIPERKHYRVKTILPVLAVVIIVLPAIVGLAANAISEPKILTLINPSANKRTSETNEVQNEVDRAHKTRDNQPTASSTAPPVVSAQSTSSSAVRPEPSKTSYSSKSTVLLTSTPVSMSTDSVDTSLESMSVSNAQAAKSVQPVTYSSAKISFEHRNELLRVSAIIAATAGVLYALSYATVVWRLLYGAPVRPHHSLPQQ